VREDVLVALVLVISPSDDRHFHVPAGALDLRAQDDPMTSLSLIEPDVA